MAADLPPALRSLLGLEPAPEPLPLAVPPAVARDAEPCCPHGRTGYCQLCAQARGWERPEHSGCLVCALPLTSAADRHPTVLAHCLAHGTIVALRGKERIL